MMYKTKHKEQIFLFLRQKTGINVNYFLKNSAWVGFREFFTIGCGLLTVAFIARIVPKEIYGQYQFVLAIIAIISITSIPGLNTAILQSVARGFDGSYKKSVRIRFLWSLLGCLVLLTLGLYWHFLKHSIIGIPIIISSFFFSLLYAPNAWETFLQGKAKFKITTKYIIFKTAIFSAAFIITIMLFPSNLLAITFCYLFINSILNIILYKRSLGYIQNKKIDEDTIPYGFFITKISILNLISGHLDKLIIALFIGPVELAIYTMGINLIKKFTGLLKGFMSITTPIVSKKNTLSKKNYSILFFISLVISATLYFSLPFIVTVLLSSKYSDSVAIARTITLFLPFFMIGLLYKNHFTFFVKNKKILLLESFVSPLIKIFLILILSFYLGLIGLALAFGIQYFIPTLVLFTLSVFLNKQHS